MNSFLATSFGGPHSRAVAVGYSKDGTAASWGGSQIKLVIIEAYTDQISELVNGYLNDGMGFDTNITHTAVIVTEQASYRFTRTDLFKPHGEKIVPLWTPDAIREGREIYVAMPGLKPLERDDHAVMLGLMVLFQKEGRIAIRNFKTCPTVRKGWWERLKEILCG